MPGAKKNGLLRESDLDGHLANGQDKDAERKSDKPNGKTNGKDKDDDFAGLAIADYTTAKDRQFVEAIKRLGGKPPVAATKDSVKDVAKDAKSGATPAATTEAAPAK